MYQRVAALERQAAVSDERHAQNILRFDKLDGMATGMDAKLDRLIERNLYEDGSANARGKFWKALGVWTVAIGSGSGMTYLFNWLFGKHP